MAPLPRPLRIAVMNDYPIIVLGVSTMLEPYPDRVELVELDPCGMPGADVDIVLFDTFAHLDGEHPSLADVIGVDGPKVAVFTWVSDPVAVDLALAQGAAGYLSKTLAPLDLLKSLEDICSGAVVTSDEYAVNAAVDAADIPALHYALSPREAEVLALIAKGLSNKDIARALFLSVNSIKTYVRTAYAKIGVHSRSQAVVWAHQNHFAPKSAGPRAVEQTSEQR
ncbi:MAG: response regulator transcription factor [Nocardioides sp.]|jgi:DNA-binding NarL/FixJ family response regulator|nr:response regulator transcription factor [Nocardioides sp.]